MRIKPEKFSLFQLDHSQLRPLLQAAPKEHVMRVRESVSFISLPMPDGSQSRFRLVESPIMEPELAARYPEIKTYAASGIDDPTQTARLDFTPAGFHAQILSHRGAVYIDPVLAGDTNTYASYYKRDHRQTGSDFQCLARSADGSTASSTVGVVGLSSLPVASAGVRTYRLACAATAEYTRFQGGTVIAGLAAIVSAINRVSGVYEAEAGIRLVLVANNDRLIYTDATRDPYHLAKPTQLLSLNQSNLDTVIGNDHYDVGHVFSTSGGGLAGLGVACVAGAKAAGETGMAAPVGDSFYIDYVAHELGHQFGAHHTFNSSSSACGGGNRNAATAFEPGSGSTIMSYAGICGSDNLQSHSDPYFHSATLEEISAYTTSGAGDVAPLLPRANAVTPAVISAAHYTIPQGTPFTLTAEVNNPSQDRLTYCWEERDLGPAISLAAVDNGSSPLFRSFSPTTNAGRTFPQLEHLLNRGIGDGETLPMTARTLNFRVTLRDLNLGGSPVSAADAQVSVATNAGPFLITSPSASVTWSNVQTVTWSVAGTTNAPVNAASVNILLSTNGGLSFPLVLAANVPNTGSQRVALPSLASRTCRLRVEAADNIFFDISRSNFTLVPYLAAPQLVLEASQLLMESAQPNNGRVDPGETVLVNFELRNEGALGTTNLVATLESGQGVVSPSAPQSYGALWVGGESVARPFSFTAAGNCGDAVVAVLHLQDGARDLGRVTNRFCMGSASSLTQSFTNAIPIAIRDLTNASLYPSAIQLTDVPGTVTRVTVTLRGLKHTRPADLDILLVGPGGRNVLLMSDTGTNISATNLTLIFDDAATKSLPRVSRLTSGTFRPTNYDTTSDKFRAPAPVGPFGLKLSAFNGLSANGTWALFVRDDGAKCTGSIVGGWSLSVATTNMSCASEILAGADPAVWTEAYAAAGTSVGRPQLALPPRSFIVHAGETLSVTNPAAIAGCGYRLAGQIPPGASIDSVTGDFRWTPSDAQAPSTNLVTIEAVEASGQAVAASQNFAVLVMPRPVVSSLTFSNQSVTLTWDALAGRSYRVEYRDDLSATNWASLAPDVQATGSTAATVDNNGLVPQRFYRIRVLP